MAWKYSQRVQCDELERFLRSLVNERRWIDLRLWTEHTWIKVSQNGRPSWKFLALIKLICKSYRLRRDRRVSLRTPREQCHETICWQSPVSVPGPARFLVLASSRSHGVHECSVTKLHTSTQLSFWVHTGSKWILRAFIHITHKARNNWKEVLDARVLTELGTQIPLCSSSKWCTLRS